MPAVNLLYVTKDNVFNCFDKITGSIKKSYAVGGAAIPAIEDALQANTVLVIPSHSAADTHRVSFNGVYYSVSDYANLILARITNRNKVSKIVYLICSAEATVAQIAGVSQVAPGALLTYSVGPPPLLTVDGSAGLSPNSAIGLTATANGFNYHAAG